MTFLEARLQEIEAEFAFLGSWNDRYARLIEMGRELPVWDESEKTEENFVPGCTSPIWLKAEIVENRFEIRGFSTGVLPNGLVALVIKLFSGSSPREADQWNEDVSGRLGLRDHLTPTRAEAFEGLLQRVRALVSSAPIVKKPRVADSYDNRFGGLTRLFGDEVLRRMKSSHVAVVGLGGVGSWVVESLARSGVGAMTLIDSDDLCVTNVNRQLPAVTGSLGYLKSQVLADRVRLINPECEVQTVPEFLTEKNVETLLAPPTDFVVDAIDSVADKAALIHFCRDRKVPLIVSGGAGGKTDPTQIRVADLGREQGDSLLKAVKRQLKKTGAVPESSGLYHVPCVFSVESPVLPWEICSSVASPDQGGSGRIDCSTGFGAASFVTGAFGLTLASYVVRNLADR